MKRVVAFAFAALLVTTIASAESGSICHRVSECGPADRWVCVAACDTCSVGHCTAMHVLP